MKGVDTMAILARLGVVRHAFCVRTFDRRVLINHADGTFYDRDLASAETIDQLYPKIRSLQQRSYDDCQAQTSTGGFIQAVIIIPVQLTI